MAYATQQELIDWCGIGGGDELIQLTDPTNTAIDSLLVAKKLQQADAEINARLPSDLLPMTAPYPPLLVLACCKIARAYLYPVGRPEHVETDYRDALKFLDDVRAGKATLGLDSTGAETVPVSSGFAVSASPRVFTDAVLETL